MSKVLQELQKQGYMQDMAKCDLSGFQIDKSYRFEGESDPSDLAVVYAISSKTKAKKGVLIDAYGTYADPQLDKKIKALPIAKSSAQKARTNKKSSLKE